MKRRGRALFFVASLVIFLASIYVVYRGVVSFREARILDDVLTRIDARIDAGRLQDVPDLLDQATRVVSSPANALRLLKRAVRLTELTEDYSALRERSRFWHRRFARNSRITALAVFAGLRVEDRQAAMTALHPEDRFFEDFPHLGAAYLLYRYSGDPGELPAAAAAERGLSGAYPYRLLSLDGSSPSTAFFEAAEATGRREYAANGVLQLAAGGVLRDALLQAEAMGLTPTDPLLVATLAYDVGDWQKAADLLAPFPANDRDSLSLRGDAMYLAGRHQTARQAYETLFGAGRPEGPRAINNAALLPSTPEERLQLLREGVRRYPGDPVLVAALTGYLGPRETRRLLDQLEGLIAESAGQPGPSSGYGELVLYLLSEADRRPPDANAAQLWALANRYPETVAIRRYLAWFLAGIDRREEVGRAVEGPAADVSRSLAFYRGLYHNSRGRREEAFIDFLSAHHGRYTWQAAYNAGVVGLELNRLAEVRELLRNAQGEAWYRLSDAERSRLKLVEARLFIAEGNREAARRATREALALSPESTAATRLHDALEDE
jgi:hypothetical protein